MALERLVLLQMQTFVNNDKVFYINNTWECN